MAVAIGEEQGPVEVFAFISVSLACPFFSFIFFDRGLVRRLAQPFDRFIPFLHCSDLIEVAAFRGIAHDSALLRV